MGKLAQPVPVMVARALELFAKSLLLAAGEVAQQAGARTLTPLHLKTAVEEDERLDFLRCKVGATPVLEQKKCTHRWRTCRSLVMMTLRSAPRE